MYRDITIRLQCISLETFILKEAGWVLRNMDVVAEIKSESFYL
jgi:hypothetical protein